MVELENHNTIKAFIPIDFGTCLQPTHLSKDGLTPFKEFIKSLKQPALVKEYIKKVQGDLESKKAERIKHRDDCAEALQISEKEHKQIKEIWGSYTEKLANDCQTGQTSLI